MRKLEHGSVNRMHAIDHVGDAEAEAEEKMMMIQFVMNLYVNGLTESGCVKMAMKCSPLHERCMS